MKYITVFFDLEGWNEVPHRGKFDIEKVVDDILKVLKKHEVKAVFNTLGIIAEKFPRIVRKIHDEGHEIGIHGYSHENFVQLNFDELDGILEKAEKAIEKIIGEKPLGVRAPWLYHDKKSYDVFRKRGYKWVSNHSFYHRSIFERPDSEFGKGIFMSVVKRMIVWYKAFVRKKGPFRIGSLMEIPLLSLLDGDMLGLVDVEQKSPKEWMDFAYKSLREQYHESENYFNLNFHPWLIGSSNRLWLLDNILGYVKSKSDKFVLAKEIN